MLVIILRQLSQESQGILHHQTGTGEHASQKGMSIGKVRMAADTPTDEMAMESQGVLHSQTGTGEHASQKGMNMGYTWHAGDHP
ncbi:hypothetical protein EB796_014383 [Bugula neritina]|uniref:Uncharacterized protein n=1 Tax=Bugula neritina TaxID=10212 RepID=A0A7J7JLQ5_BUGNE|nr:hypothetical protein EB796_014383 [Bugula neritina]